jgi:type VII secretion integral membrane protein EccD
VSVVGGRTQLDVALPVDIPVASLVPELVKLVRSRDVDTSSDTPWPAAQHTFWVLSRRDSATPLPSNDTLRAAGVVDGELLHLREQRALSAPTLYDDVVDAAARLNKSAYAGWNAAAARWISFAGLAAASLVWAYVLAVGAHRVIIVGLAVVVVAAMVGGAALAYRWYGQADVAAAVGWSTIPISTAIVWVLCRGFGGHSGAYGLAAGCAALVMLNAACYWAIGTGRWGYLAGGVFFAGGELAMLAHALGVSARIVGVLLAVSAVLACLAVSRLAGRLARVEPSTSTPAPDREEVMSANPFAPQPPSTGSGGSGGQDFSTPSFGAMPTGEAVWAYVRSAAVTGSALYAGLGITVFCAVTTALRVESHGPESHGPESHVDWAALTFAGVCAAALALYARIPGTAAEQASLGVPAAALVVAACVSAQNGTPQVAWSGFGILLAVAVVASVTGLRAAGGNVPRRWATAWTYLQYVAFAGLIPVALWALGIYAQLEIR